MNPFLIAFLTQIEMNLIEDTALLRESWRRVKEKEKNGVRTYDFRITWRVFYHCTEIVATELKA